MSTIFSMLKSGFLIRRGHMLLVLRTV